MEAVASAAVEAAVEWLGKHFDAGAASGFSAVFVLELTGATGGSITLRLVEGALSIAAETASRRDVAIRVDAGDFLDVLSGRANGELLHMAGRVRIDGDPALVVRLQTLFRRRV